ncbi:hypothetical protein Ccar_16180 [Clostridium carboxidivorans P7]|uniref:Transcriptional regulator, XRE family n=1 Tax=Clostridium carboxidivorans P7 TaxID=536227 RepID=C6Q141_9CLOT|nr:helix-turn-helix transcriptional regulator [Clostridium carboxidivorans]AKN32316.1 hypothetical protein Ccar_16180 [Clostridium carboxidivorans P7]EET84777.1 transcriptional regulator, XRE family [Clostridium carboxidivorans P7]
MLSEKKLKEIRLIKNLSLQDVGDRIGCSKNYVSMLENGKKPFNQEFYRKWIDALYGIYDIRKTEDYINKLNEEAEKEVIKNKSNSKKSTTKAKKTVTK